MSKNKMGAAGVTFAFGAAVPEAQASEFEQCREKLSGPLKDAAARTAAGAAKDESGYGWFNLPEADTEDIKRTARWLAGHGAIVHVGIGGSALGNLMLHQSLLPMYYNEHSHDSAEDCDCPPRFYLADNPDPDKASYIWERVAKDASISRLALIGVSKSGSTAETMSQFLWFKAKMEEVSAGKADSQILVITDPDGGVFRKYAKATGCRSLEIPPSVGGRFSVLTPCGLVTAAALGADIDALLAGAKEMKEYLLSCTADENPAYQLAALHIFHEKHGRPMSVMMPYANHLETFAEWYAQLWAESLGKDGLGTTPVRALGAIDQHSQVQLYTAGPDDKFYTIIDAAKRDHEIELPVVKDESLSSLSYLAGHKMGEMLRCEAKSTAAALIKRGRPLLWVEMEKTCPRTIGALVFFYEYLTAITGLTMGINPFDQPGVEQGKKYTYGMMGRDGFGDDAKEAAELFGRIGG